MLRFVLLCVFDFFVHLFGGDVNPVPVHITVSWFWWFCMFRWCGRECTGGGGSGSVGGRLGNHVTGSLLVFVVLDAGMM